MPLTRRELLVALGAVVITGPAGCTVFDDEPAPPLASAPPSPPPPDLLLPLLAIEGALLAQYDATLARYPQLVSRAGPIRADHAAHLGALRAIVGTPATSESAPARPAASPPRIVIPATSAAALAVLRSAEAAAGRRLASACLSAPPARAALLGSIAACESAHLVLLQ